MTLQAAQQLIVKWRANAARWEKQATEMQPGPTTEHFIGSAAQAAYCADELEAALPDDDGTPACDPAPVEIVTAFNAAGQPVKAYAVPNSTSVLSPAVARRLAQRIVKTLLNEQDVDNATHGNYNAETFRLRIGEQWVNNVEAILRSATD